MNSRSLRVGALLLCCSLVAACNLSAQSVISSTFLSGDEGWTIVNWSGGSNPVTPTWKSTGGNPDGYLLGTDVHGDGFWRAPASFRGDWTSAYGGTLSYDAFATYNDWKMNDVYIVGNGQTLSYWFTNNPTAQWGRFQVRLDVSAGWQYGLHYDTIGPAATEEQIRSVLTDVTDFRIREEYAWGADYSGLDNVVLPPGTPFPHPRFGVPIAGAGEITLTIHHLEPGRTYRLEQSLTLSSPSSWQPVTTFTATAPDQLLALPMTNTSTFYRARTEE